MPTLTDQPVLDWSRGPARTAAAITLAAAGLFALASLWSAAAPPSRSSIAGATPSTIDLNAADQAELESLPGVGPALAKRIIDHRHANGPFDSVDALDAVRGIGPVTIERLRPFVSAR